MIFEKKYYYFWNGKYREKYFRGFKSFCEKYLWGKYFREKSSNIFDATYKIGDIIERKITFSNIDIVINCLPETIQTTHIFDNKLLKKFSKPFII